MARDTLHTVIDQLTTALGGLPSAVRILVFIGGAVAIHMLVKGTRRAAEGVLIHAPGTPPTGAGPRDTLARRYPKIATVTSLVVSGLTFVVYFAMIGAVLGELGISLTAYLATASVVGLAVGFGSQGLVQDIVIGLTLVFSDVVDIGDMIEVSGQVGRVEEIGLRFTRLLNFQGQTVFVPNRNITLVGRYRRGVVRAYVDVQVPADADEGDMTERIDALARGVRSQYPSIVLSDPEIFGVQSAGPGAWRYLRVKFRVWPGQTAVIETVFRQRALAAMKTLSPDFADWMISVVYRVV